MVVKTHNSWIITLLLLATGIMQVMASCSKLNKNPMAILPIDSIPVLPAQTDTSVKTYLALGDSYTIATSISIADSYPFQTTALLKKKGYHFSDPVIIATNGWTTVNLLNALHSGPPPLPKYDIVTLLIGVNDQYQGGTQSEYSTNFSLLLQKAILLAGNQPAHVIVISIPDYSVTPFGKATGNAAYVSKQIDSFNNINKSLSDQAGTGYLNVTDESRNAANDPSLIAPDQLHFSAKEYAIWSSALAALIEKVVP
jgi:lysophospholipase L1-like esterase